MEYNKEVIAVKGFIPERKGDYGAYRYTNIYGELDADKYVIAGAYINGFAKVYINGEKYFRDLIGNVSKQHTKLGETFNRYNNDEIKALEIPEEFLADDKLFNMVVKLEKDRTAYDWLTTQEEIDEIVETLKLKREAVVSANGKQ